MFRELPNEYVEPHELKNAALHGGKLCVILGILFINGVCCLSFEISEQRDNTLRHKMHFLSRFVAHCTVSDCYLVFVS